MKHLIEHGLLSMVADLLNEKYKEVTPRFQFKAEKATARVEVAKLLLEPEHNCITEGEK